MKLKELEKLGPKLKGIVSQSVKEVLQSLVDDGLVQGDKIGSSNFFWSFPSQRGAILQGRLNAVKETRDKYETQLAELRVEIQAAKAARPESEERDFSLGTLAASKKELTVLEQELNNYGACDPAKVEDKKRGVTLAKEASIRWTDNYSMLFSHFTRQTGLNPEEIRKYLEIGDDYEDIC